MKNEQKTNFRLHNVEKLTVEKCKRILNRNAEAAKVSAAIEQAYEDLQAVWHIFSTKPTPTQTSAARENVERALEVLWERLVEAAKIGSKLDKAINRFCFGGNAPGATKMVGYHSRAVYAYYDIKTDMLFYGAAGQLPPKQCSPDYRHPHVSAPLPIRGPMSLLVGAGTSRTPEDLYDIHLLLTTGWVPHRHVLPLRPRPDRNVTVGALILLLDYCRTVVGNAQQGEKQDQPQPYPEQEIAP
jgi:hypothetical protein